MKDKMIRLERLLCKYIQQYSNEWIIIISSHCIYCIIMMWRNRCCCCCEKTIEHRRKKQLLVDLRSLRTDCQTWPSSVVNLLFFFRFFYMLRRVISSKAERKESDQTEGLCVSNYMLSLPEGSASLLINFIFGYFRWSFQ